MKKHLEIRYLNNGKCVVISYYDYDANRCYTRNGCWFPISDLKPR